MDAIDTALIGTLAADATLAALVPGGWYMDVAPAGISEPWGIVSQQASEDEDICGRVDRRFDNRLYQVKAVAKANTAANPDAAAARVEVVLLPAAGLELSATGYDKTIIVRRDSRVRYVEAEKETRWQHAGGIFAVELQKT